MEKRMVEEAIPSWANPKTWPEGFEAGKLSDNFQSVTTSAIGTEIVSQNLSSSEIRKRFCQEVSLVEGLVPSVVLNHMLRYRLYTPVTPTINAEIEVKRSDGSWAPSIIKVISRGDHDYVYCT